MSFQTHARPAGTRGHSAARARARAAISGRTAIAGCAPVLWLLVAGCASTAAVSVERHVHRIPIAVDLEGPRPRILELRLQDGHVLVMPGGELACELHVEVPAQTRAAAERLARGLRLSPQGDNTLEKRIVVEPPADLALVDLHSEFRLTIPADVALRIYSTGGDVTLRGFRGDVQIRTESGRIRADLDGGAADFVSRSGHTRLGGDFRSAHIVSGRGDVVVALPHSLAAAPGCELSLQTDSGRLRLQAVESDDLELVFDTDFGAVLSELPIRWLRHDENPRRTGVRYVGRLGATESFAAALTVNARSRTGNLEVVRQRGHLLGTAAAAAAP